MVDRKNLTDEIGKLAQLHTDGVLSEEEFRAAKASLLSSQQPTDGSHEVRLPTSGQVMRFGLGVAFRAFLLLYVVLPLAGLVLMGICLWLVKTFP
jgi:cytochrome c-type biogenesis protein CcmH/NrfG